MFAAEQDEYITTNTLTLSHASALACHAAAACCRLPCHFAERCFAIAATITRALLRRRRRRLLMRFSSIPPHTATPLRR